VGLPLALSRGDYSCRVLGAAKVKGEKEWSQFGIWNLRLWGRTCVSALSYCSTTEAQRTQRSYPELLHNLKSARDIVKRRDYRRLGEGRCSYGWAN
jgi:hypothetical protein